MFFALLCLFLASNGLALSTVSIPASATRTLDTNVDTRGPYSQRIVNLAEKFEHWLLGEGNKFNPRAIAQEVENELNMIFHSSVEEDQEALADTIQMELAAILRLSHFADRCISKPLGYAGDYLMIEEIYDGKPKGWCNIGKKVDSICLSLTAARAVQNRRQLLCNEIEAIVQRVNSEHGRCAHITSLACGPARELKDFVSSRQPSADYSFHLVDMDEQALDHVKGWITDNGKSYIDGQEHSLHRANLIHLCSRKKKLELPLQDLVYSIGLIDYFSDSLVVRLLDYVYDMLRPGGKVIFGNFHPRNPTRVFMDVLLDWKLNYRTEEDMKQLFQQSKFGRDCQIMYEDENVNLFAVCEKPTKEW
jgi:extracellular factor (EF) 3-hydroxypalmitic acid methyl ester biosynthesis protein